MIKKVESIVMHHVCIFKHSIVKVLQTMRCRIKPCKTFKQDLMLHAELYMKHKTCGNDSVMLYPTTTWQIITGAKSDCFRSKSHVHS